MEMIAEVSKPGTNLHEAWLCLICLLLEGMQPNPRSYIYTGPLAVISSQYTGDLLNFKKVMFHYYGSVEGLTLSDMTNWGHVNPDVKKWFTKYDIQLNYPFIAETVLTGEKGTQKETIPMSSALKSGLFATWIGSKVVPERTNLV